MGYWMSSTDTAVATYACTGCTAEWVGGDCSVTVTVVETSVQWRAAVVFSSYLTTWDGASLALVIPGTYHLIQVEGVDLLALFLPCPQRRLCRLISAISLTVDTFHLKVVASGEHSSNFTSTLAIEGQPEDMSFPKSKTWGRVSLVWWRYSYLRVTVDSKLTVVVGASSAGLTVATKLHQDWFAQTSGLLGLPDGNHINDLMHSSATTNADLMAARVSEHQRKKFLLTDKDLSRWLGEGVAGQNLSTCGHMLRLTHHSLTFAQLSVVITTRQLTLTFWLRVEALLSESRTVMEVMTSAGVIRVSVRQQLILLTWFGGETAVLRSESIGTWTYLALIWDDSVASLTAFAIQESGFDYTTLHVDHLSVADLVVTDLTLVGPQTSQSAVEIDLVRLWQSAKPLESIADDLRVYASDPGLDPRTSLPVLLMSAGFDEGDGDRTFLSVHGMATPSTVPAVIEVTPQADPAPPTVWKPSTIPVLDVVLPEDVFHTPDTNQSAQACLTALQETSLQTHCADLHAFFSLYLEACVREHQRTGSADITRTVADMLAFYCHTSRKVGECQLDQYVDFCEPVEDELPVWVIIVICIGVLIVASCCCCFVAFIISKKKKKRKRERHLTGSVTHLSSAETSFIREDSAHLASVQPDVGIVNPTYDHRVSAAPIAVTRPVGADKPRADKGKKSKGLLRSRKTDIVATAPLDRPSSSSSSERPHSGFSDRPHMEAWTSSGKKHPISGRQDKWSKEFMRQSAAPLGFYTSQEDTDIFIYSPEEQAQAPSAPPPQATSMQSGRRRPEREVAAEAAQPSVPHEMYRMQSIPDQDTVILDELEVEDPTPIVYRRDDDDLRCAPSSRLTSRRGTADTVDNINLAFEED